MSHVEIRLVVTEYPDDNGKPIERFRVPVDPLCATINASQHGPTSATVAHPRNECRCGDMQALTGPPGKPQRRPMASPSAHDAFCDGTCTRGEPGPCPKTPKVHACVDHRPRKRSACCREALNRDGTCMFCCEHQTGTTSGSNPVDTTSGPR